MVRKVKGASIGRRNGWTILGGNVLNLGEEGKTWQRAKAHEWHGWSLGVHDRLPPERQMGNLTGQSCAIAPTLASHRSVGIS